MINRQKLIEALEEVERRFPYKVAGKPDTYREFNMAWESCMDCVFLAVESQPPADQWIPCSREPPKQNQHIIGTFENDEGKRFVCDDVYFPPILSEPWPLIAWMPAEPYKGVE